MKMSDVFTGPELTWSGLFRLAFEEGDYDETNKAIDYARHAANCHDELVEALQAVMTMQTRGYVVLGVDVTEMARAALAKAKG